MIGVFMHVFVCGVGVLSVCVWQLCGASVGNGSVCVCVCRDGVRLR